MKMARDVERQKGSPRRKIKKKQKKSKTVANKGRPKRANAGN
jgi:hypothetical protein